MIDDELVQGRAGGYQYRGGFSALSSGTAGSLPGAGDSTRISGENSHIQAADINSQLQGIGGYDSPDFSLPEIFLDFPAFKGQISPPVTADEAFLVDVFLKVAL